MNSPRLSTVVACLVVAWGTVSGAQEQAPHSVRTYCIKVAPESVAAYTSLARETLLPMMKSRVATGGDLKGFDVLRAVVPNGTSARCNFINVYHYGLLPEDVPSLSWGQDLARAGIDMTVDELWSKLRKIGEVVGEEWWWYLERVGPAWPDGSYVTINHWQLKDGVSWDDHAAFGRRVWKPIVEAMIADGRKVSWDDVGVWAPSRADGYQTLTLDVFHDWETMTSQIPYLFGEGGVWKKVHPDMTPAQLTRHDALLRRTLFSNLYRVIATTTE